MHEIIQEDVKAIVSELEQFRPQIQGKTFLITGGSGFLGSWFCDVLDSFGARIICVDNLSSGDAKNVQHLTGNPNFTFVNKNLLDFEPDGKIDYIVHMASIATPPLYMQHPIETLDSNILGIRKLLEIARKNNVSGFLFMSTSEIYGDPDDANIPTKEDFRGFVNSFGPRCMYDEGKRAAEAYCYSYHQKFGMPIRIARTFNTFGPRLDVKGTSQYGRAIIKFIHQAIRNEPITVYGDGKQTRSFCYITDQITGLFKLLLTPGIDGQVFNIGNGTETSMIDLSNTITSSVVSSSKIVFNSPANYNLKDDPRRRCPDTSKANQMLGYSPKVQLSDGIKRTAEWMKANME
jgi:UDP-glucuronate decarboxylase